jgi:hypothetical protein
LSVSGIAHLSAQMQNSYDSYHGVYNSYGFEQYESFHEDPFEQPYYDSVCDQSYHHTFFENQDNCSQSFCQQFDQPDQTWVSPEVTDFIFQQGKVNQMFLEQLQAMNEQLDRLWSQKEGVNNPSGNLTLTDTCEPCIQSIIFIGEASNKTLHSGSQTDEFFMPAESGQSRLGADPRQHSCGPQETPCSPHDAQQGTPAGSSAANSPVATPHAQPSSPQGLPRTPQGPACGPQEEGIEAEQVPDQHTSIFFCPPSFPLDPEEVHYQRSHMFPGSPLLATIRQVWISFPFDVKHYQWSELSQGRA